MNGKKKKVKTFLVEERILKELKQLVDEGLFMNVSEAIRTGVMIIILLNKLNPEVLKTLKELTEELRRYNENMEKELVKKSPFSNIWKFSIEI